MASPNRLASSKASLIDVIRPVVISDLSAFEIPSLNTYIFLSAFIPPGGRFFANALRDSAFLIIPLYQFAYCVGEIATPGVVPLPVNALEIAEAATYCLMSAGTFCISRLKFVVDPLASIFMDVRILLTMSPSLLRP